MRKLYTALILFMFLSSESMAVTKLKIKAPYPPPVGPEIIWLIYEGTIA